VDKLRPKITKRTEITASAGSVRCETLGVALAQELSHSSRIASRGDPAAGWNALDASSSVA